MAAGAGPFAFDFAELRPRPALQLMAPVAVPLPEPAGLVLPPPRPRWLGRLLPVFGAPEPMRIDLVSAAAPGFACWLQRGLGGLLAAAGNEAGVRVLSGAGLLLVGAHALESMPARPHAVLVAADLSPLAAPALEAGLQGAGDAAWLVLNGDFPDLERRLGIGAARSFRLPLLGRGQMCALAAGRIDRRLGRALQRLANLLCRSYLEQR